jgi:hypothetical protein
VLPETKGDAATNGARHAIVVHLIPLVWLVKNTLEHLVILSARQPESENSAKFSRYNRRVFRSQLNGVRRCCDSLTPKYDAPSYTRRTQEQLIASQATMMQKAAYIAKYPEVYCHGLRGSCMFIMSLSLVLMPE